MYLLRPGEIVRMVRQGQSKTQEVFARELGCSAKHLCMVENSIRPVSLGLAKKIVKLDDDYALTDFI